MVHNIEIYGFKTFKKKTKPLASRWKFIRTTGSIVENQENAILNRLYGGYSTVNKLKLVLFSHFFQARD